MDKMKLEKILDAEEIALNLDAVYGDNAEDAEESLNNLESMANAVLAEVSKMREVVKLRVELAKRDRQIEELMAEMVALKAKLDAPKTGNDAPIGLS